MVSYFSFWRDFPDEVSNEVRFEGNPNLEFCDEKASWHPIKGCREKDYQLLKEVSFIACVCVRVNLIHHTLFHSSNLVSFIASFIRGAQWSIGPSGCGEMQNFTFWACKKLSPFFVSQTFLVNIQQQLLIVHCSPAVPQFMVFETALPWLSLFVAKFPIILAQNFGT